MNSDCNHASTIVIHDFGNGLILELCTWSCGCLIWYEEHNHEQREITVDEAAEILKKELVS